MHLVALVVTVVAATVTAAPALPREWEVLGPFAWGMRELGGDPLEAYVAGGSAALPFPCTTMFASELVDGGLVKAHTVAGETDGTVRVTFDDVRWDFNRQFFGWTANQWQAWARGQFTVEAADAGVYGLRCQSVGEFWIDGDQGAHGDWYSYGELWHRIVLTAGVHLLRVRLASEMRLFGGTLPPTVTFRCELRDLRYSSGIVLSGQRIFPDVRAATGQLFSPFAGIGVFNPHSETLLVDSIVSNSTQIQASLLGKEPVAIATGQARRVAFLLTNVAPLSAPFVVSLLVNLRQPSGTIFPFEITQSIAFRTDQDAFSLTFVDYDGSVQYTMLKRPLNRCPVQNGCPPIVTLHGAGVEASSDAWTNAYPIQPYAWILYPTGRTPWGYDWHGASRINVESALAASVAYAGADQIDASRVFISGHSNGGQGCWYFASHYPDRFVAANPAAGYMKIQFYVPFYWRPGDAHADPVLRALLETAIAEFDTDFYTPNLLGLPLIARTGGADDNVPPINSRRLVRLLNELNGAAAVPPLSEVPGQGHYHDGIMTDSEVGEFLIEYTQVDVALPAFPMSFDVVTLNPASSGGRGGLIIQQVYTYGRAARLHVTQESPQLWSIWTENVRRFAFTLDARVTATQIKIGNSGSVLPVLRQPEYQYCRLENTWAVCPDQCRWCADERSPMSSGPVLQVYDRPFVIIRGSTGLEDENMESLHGAVMIANDWLQHGNGDAEILTDKDALNRTDLGDYNLIVVGGPEVNLFCKTALNRLPVTFAPGGRSFIIGPRVFDEPSTGVLFTAPWKAGLAVVASGIDAPGLRLAVQQFPVRTGTTVPDFVVVGNEQPWKAAGAILGAGFWSYNWTFNEVSGYLRERQ